MLRSALRLEPADAAARRQIASLELKAGDWEIALLDLQAAEEFAPGDPDAFVTAAQILVDKGWLEAPEAVLDRAIEIAPTRTDARRLRRYIRFRLGRYFGAQQDAPRQAGETVPPKAAPRSQRLDGRDVSFRLEQWAGRLGDLRQQLESAVREKSWNDAEHLVLEAGKVASGTAFPPFMQGTLDLARGDATAAERDFIAALAEAPRSAVVAGALGRAWARQGGAAFAGDRLMQLAEKDPGFTAVRYLAARAFVEAGDPLKAEGALRHGLELQPGSPLPYRHLTDYYFGIDRIPEALETCRQGADRFPGDVGLRMMQAQIESGMGQHDEAIRTYQQLSTERPDLDLVLYKLAGELPTSDPRFFAVMREIQGDEPVDPEQSDALGWLLLKAGQLDPARQRLEVAVRDSPANPTPHYHLAVLSSRSGDPARAKQELQLALGSGQPFAERLDALRLLRETSGR
ncbi:MAG: tetratricopeptide repeat protein [Myxococcales bacterium]